MHADLDQLPKFQRLQYQFCAKLRDPDHHPVPPGIEDRRMAVYVELIYNNCHSLISSTFPVIKAIAGDEYWGALIRGFLAEYEAHSPLSFEIGRDFHRYLAARAERGAGDPPYFPELAHYEFAEVQVDFDERDIADYPHDPAGDLLAGLPLVSPVALPLVYRFDVHRISPEYQPDEPPAQPTCLIVVRNREDQIGFMEGNPATLKLIEVLKENPELSGLDALKAIAGMFPAEMRDAVIAAGAGMLQALHARDVILGTRI